MLNVTHTSRSYTGKPGCMCGCNGTYNEGERARKMALTAMHNNPDARLDDWGYVDSDGDAGCLYFETDTRNRVVYLTSEGAAVARTLFTSDK